MVSRFIIFILSFFLIWFGAGITISGVNRLSKKLNLSSFAVSFFVLGILTSIPELALGINAIIDNNPPLFIGNLIGGQIVLFFLIIPLLAIVGNGIKLFGELKSKKIFLAFFVIALPAFVILDRKVHVTEGIFLIVSYGLLFFLFQKRKGLVEGVKDRFHQNDHSSIFQHIGAIMTGVALVFVSSKVIVDNAIYFSQEYNISAYLIGLLILSLGTNLPELSFAVRAVHMGKKDIALGDYIGSASANTLIFGILIALNRKTVSIQNHFILTFLFLVGGMALFLYFIRSKNILSRTEGIVLILLYLAFFILEAVI